MSRGLAGCGWLCRTYTGSKAPLERFTRAAAKEFADRWISVNTVAPVPMDTPSFYGQEAPGRVAFHKSQAMGNQLTQIQDIVPIIRFPVTEGWWFTRSDDVPQRWLHHPLILCRPDAGEPGRPPGRAGFARVGTLARSPVQLVAHWGPCRRLPR